MKKGFIFLFTLILIITSLGNTSNANAVAVVKISEPTHRLSNGVFIDHQLATQLLPNGDLGLLI